MRTKAAKRASIWRSVPGYLAAALLLTLVVALVQQGGRLRERRALFEGEANQIQLSIEGAIDDAASNFQTSMNFIAATHPGPLDEYRNFFGNRLDDDIDLPDADPGVLFVEAVDAGAIDDLIEREHQLGNTDFRVFALPGSSTERLIVTRTARRLDVFGLTVIGLDVTSVADELAPEPGLAEGFALRIVDSATLDQLVAPGRDDADALDGFEDVNAVLVGAVSDRDGDLIGYATRFLPVRTIVSTLDEKALQGLNVHLHVGSLETPVAGLGSGHSSGFEDASLSDQRTFVTASLEMRVDVWADPGFGPSTALVDQVAVWVVGAIMSLLLVAAIMWRNHKEVKLHAAQFELEHARALASTDALTGLLNRQGLIDAARRYDESEPATLFFVDLDGFKAVNDSDGHAAGDRVLRLVAERLRGIFRPQDFVGRPGGDEFVVFTLGSLRHDMVDEIAGRITIAISQIDDRVTCSVGVSARDGSAAIDVKELIRSADQAMYVAKRSGGNRFMVTSG